MKTMKGKRAVITGAGSGLGRELSLSLARENWRIAVSDIEEAKAEETLEQVVKNGGAGFTFRCDVGNFDEIAELAKQSEAKFRGIDLLVNNAGILTGGRIGELSLEKWRKTMDVNLWGVIYGCHAFIPIFKRQGWGHIVNVASNAGIACLPEMGSYNVSKAAVIALSETLRGELSTSGIGVTVVTPTYFETPLIETADFDTPDQIQFQRHMFRSSRMTTAEVAQSVLKAVGKNRLYVAPQLDAKMVWWSKRLSPSGYFNLLSLVEKLGAKKLAVKYNIPL